MVMFGLVMTTPLLSVTGCALMHAPTDNDAAPAQALVVVVAPVLNLSNSSDWDPWTVTDMAASECSSFDGVVVIPPNRTLAALRLMGKTGVETPQDALDLANEFNADATVVAAITEYQPYDPPRVGMVMQWYAPTRQQDRGGLDPVSASRSASDAGLAASTEINPNAPVLQIQKVYDASDRSLQRDVRAYDRSRSGHGSPYGWRVHLKSQELFVRYCCWATFRSMLLEREHRLIVPKSDETKRWMDKGDV